MEGSYQALPSMDEIRLRMEWQLFALPKKHFNSVPPVLPGKFWFNIGLIFIFLIETGQIFSSWRHYSWVAQWLRHPIPLLESHIQSKNRNLKGTLENDPSPFFIQSACYTAMDSGSSSSKPFISSSSWRMHGFGAPHLVHWSRNFGRSGMGNL